MSVITAAPLRLRAIFCGLSLGLLTAAPAYADPFSPPKSKATLTLTYTLTSSDGIWIRERKGRELLRAQ